MAECTAFGEEWKGFGGAWELIRSAELRMLGSFWLTPRRVGFPMRSLASLAGGEKHATPAHDPVATAGCILREDQMREVGPEHSGLASNGFVLETTADRLGHLKATDPGEGLGEIRERLATDGYLWLKGLLRRHEVIDLRRRILSALEPLGLLAVGTDLAEGIFAGHDEHRGEAHRVLGEVVRWEAFEAFCASKAVQALFEALFGCDIHLHRRKILRYTVPGDPSCTGAHYDLTYLRAGSDGVCTAWIPIGDTPVEMGGLIYLEGSDAAGRAMEAAYAPSNASLAPGERISAYNKNMTAEGWVTKDLPSLARRLNSRWLVADYEAGDVVVHSAYMIHAATVNNDPARRIRLSTEIRYQSVTERIDTRWNSDWTPDDGL